MNRLGIDRRPDTDSWGCGWSAKTQKQFTSQPIEPATTAFGQAALTPLS